MGTLPRRIDFLNSVNQGHTNIPMSANMGGTITRRMGGTIPRHRQHTHMGKMLYSGLKGLSALGAYRNLPTTQNAVSYTLKNHPAKFNSFMRNVVVPFETRTGFLNNYVVPHYMKRNYPPSKVSYGRKYNGNSTQYKGYSQYNPQKQMGYNDLVGTGPNKSNFKKGYKKTGYKRNYKKNYKKNYY